MENPQVSAIKIYCTSNYGKFKFLKGNRDLNSKKVKRIIESVENGLNLFPYCPVMVNKDGYVIDGQHRYFVCKKLSLPVHYVVVNDFTLRQVAEMNQNASKWTDKDFLNCYIDIGNKHYAILRDFVEKYQVNLGIASSLLSEGRVRGVNRMDDLRDGLFKSEFLSKASDFLDCALKFKDFCDSYKSRNFLQALETLLSFKDFNISELIDKLKLHNLTIETRSTPKEYLTHLEDLFNYKNSKRKRIY